jgi:aryl-alcohol dehydrogenase-like predicted oxidoreductase
MGLGEGGADAGDELAGPAGLEAEPQPVLPPLAVATRGLRQPVAGAQHPLGLAEQQPAGVGRDRAVAPAVEEPDAELGLQALDGVAQRRLADVEAFGGTPEVALVGDREEVAQLASLRALRTDHLDLLWLHTWDGTTPVEEVLRAAGQLANAGKILYFGLSDTPAWVVSQAVAIAKAHGSIPPIAVQVEYSLAERTPERELLPMAESLDLGVAAWGPLAAGLLTGKYTRRSAGARRPGSHRFADDTYAALAGAPAADRLEVAHAVDRVADELDRPSQHVALAWLRQRPGVVLPILGARDPSQLEENLAGRDLALDERQLAALDAASRPSLGFPQAFLASDTVRRRSTSGHFDRLVNHHAHHYAEFAS